jgi:hypothetical protein
MFFNEGKLYLDENEQCHKCRFFKTGQCPLLQVFYFGFADIVQPFTIDNCELFQKNERHLKAVKSDKC